MMFYSPENRRPYNQPRVQSCGSLKTPLCVAGSFRKENHPARKVLLGFSLLQMAGQRKNADLFHPGWVKGAEALVMDG